MINWKFWERPAQEQRSQPYTDAIVTLLESLSTDNNMVNERTATEEACAGLWSRAFASADVSPDTAATRALSPGILALMGRELFDQGQSVFEIQGARRRRGACARIQLERHGRRYVGLRTDSRAAFIYRDSLSAV